MKRLEAKFASLAEGGEKALIPFLMAGDPSLEWSEQILCALPESGADIIEIGMPFSDPMADGPVIQRAGLRALAAGVTLADILGLVRKFRIRDNQTPLILMGYYNPIYSYGVARFLEDALAAGVDGLIIVDTPPEEDAELCLPSQNAGLDFIRMVTPVTDEERASHILQNASGFVYAVSIAGITGTKKAGDNEMADLAGRIKSVSDLPSAIGFGIKNADDAKSAAQYFDAVVVGSAIVEIIENESPAHAKTKILTFVSELKRALTNSA